MSNNIDILSFPPATSPWLQPVMLCLGMGTTSCEALGPVGCVAGQSMCDGVGAAHPVTQTSWFGRKCHAFIALRSRATKNALLCLFLIRREYGGTCVVHRA
jgi:hypothetical protein